MRLFAAMSAIAITLAACGASGSALPGTVLQPTGSGPSRSYPASGFLAVDLAAVDDVVVRTGGAFAVRAEGDPAFLDKLRITREGGVLHVGRLPEPSTRPGGVVVYVTMPAIARASLSGTGNLTVNSVFGSAFTLDSSGTGSARIDKLSLDQARVNLSGTGDVTLGVGSVRMLIAKVSGTGALDARRLSTASASIDASGTGDVRALVNGPVMVTTDGTGNIDVGGSARCTVSNHGTGRVRCGT